MGWNNPDVPWRELEARLSGRAVPGPDRPAHALPDDGRFPDGGDGPAFSRKRGRYVPPSATQEQPDAHRDVVPYAELHCHSDFSFLDGASSPEALVEQAVDLGLTSLALTDHDGLYGAARFAEVAQSYPGLSTVFGAELSLGLTSPQAGVPDPEGSHLLLLARGVEGYHRLAGAITEAQLAGDEKGRPLYDLEHLAEVGRGHWHVLTGCRKGFVRQALASGGPSAASRALHRLVELFGAEHVDVELVDHGQPTDSVVNDALASLAAEQGLPVVATGNVHAAAPARTRLAQVMASVRARRSLSEMDGWLAASGQAYLRSGQEMARRFARHPGAVPRSVELAADLAFDLRRAAPRLPLNDVPEGHTPMTWLRELVRRGADERYAHARESVEPRLQRELAVIEEKGFAGYFLIVHDIVAEARRRKILCQGRGSAANSAVCFALHITAVDSIRYDLPFERFLSATRDEEPDIDVDFDAGRREEIIQWVYDTYGRRNAAQVANVISYQPKSAVRDVAKALGYSVGQQDAWSKGIESWRTVESRDVPIPDLVVDLATQLLKTPRHLGIHSGGMVLTERPVGEVVPIERARMENRTVLQWDKDDCAWMGLVKFDLLGLGMLGAIQRTFDLVLERTGERWDLASIPGEEPAVFDMLCRADSVGVFQVESRAQIGTLPRLRPRCFYDLVIEIALIRPGPIQGGAVHPYVRRRLGTEPVTYLHPDLQPVLERTLGVPLFQEQLMQIAMTVGDCTGDDADLLRRAMGSKRGVEKIERLKDTLYAGMRRRGIDDETADVIYAKIQAFANFGFAESHALSFGLLVYASSWLKLHFPAAFLAALLRSQPMGFYSPQSLTADARRHGVQVRRPCIAASLVDADLEPLDAVRPGAAPPTGLAECCEREQLPAGEFDADADPDEVERRLAAHRRDGRHAVRLGLTEVQGIGTTDAERIVAARSERPFSSMSDVARRTGLDVAQMESLATAGAFDVFGLSRRQAIWNAGYSDDEGRLEGTAVDVAAPTLPGMSDVELTVADLWSTRISSQDHPMQHLRELLRTEGVAAVGDCPGIESGRRVRVAGLVTHRQRPYTASGVTFLNLEDETGMLNVVVFAGVWERYRRVLRNAAGIVVRGKVENVEGATNLVAERVDVIESLYPHAAGALPGRHRSRDFQ